MADRQERFVTRDEFVHFEERIEGRLSEISEKLDRRGSSARQIWLGVGSILVTVMGLGAALVAFALRASVAPVEVRVEGVADLLVAQEVRLQGQLDHVSPLVDSNTKTVTELRARLEIVQELLFRDVRIDHGGGGGGLTEARIEQTMGRQGELWQLLETLRLQINDLSERQAVLEQKEE